MKYSGIIIIAFLCLSAARPEPNQQGYDLSADEVLCDSHCHRKYNRICVRPPSLCGPCRHNTWERDGLCLPNSRSFEEEEFNPGGDIDDIVEHEREREAQHHTLQQQAHQLSEAGMGYRPPHPRLAHRQKVPHHHKTELTKEVEQGQAEVASPPKEEVRDSLEGAPLLSHGGQMEVVPDQAALPPKTPHKPKPEPGQEDLLHEEEQPAAEHRVADSRNPHNVQNIASMADVYFLAVVAGCSVAGLVGLVVAGVCWYRLQKNVKAASEVEYPAYGIQGPTKDRVQSPGDRKLAQSAQMYHYQHQKQQMIALEKANGEMKHDGSDEDSEEENEEGDYTVYECPGLAPTGEMEVKNPLFNEETPVTPTAPGSDGHK